MQKLTEKYYNEFRGLPSDKPIVRNNQPNDAFELVVLDILYGKQLGLVFDKEHIREIQKYIIAPPDAGIDIFVEKECGDEYYYDIIQVKTGELTEEEIENAMIKMRKTIEKYCTNRMSIKSESCREILSDSNINKNAIKDERCQYFVVHMGKVNDYLGSKSDEHVISRTELERIKNNITDCVEKEIFTIDESNNFMSYGVKADTDKNQRAIVCNISGYDLAVLNNEYYSTEIGRNILFGQNLREGLNTNKSKTYEGMKETITYSPNDFWYYNNGITVIADTIKPINDKKIELTKFSIVNGAQTTSSLGIFLKEALKNGEEDKIEALKKVHVLVRILQVPKSNDENDINDKRKHIAIYNNTQNTITTRDMASIRTEQGKLKQKLNDEPYPQIYMEIRSGGRRPDNFRKLFVHRDTTNESLAQVAYASFLRQPHTAKDKRRTLFNDERDSKYTLNETYHNIFNYVSDDNEKNGILFKKTKEEIDEALFSQYLYKEGKKYLKKFYQETIDDLKEKGEDVELYQNKLDIVGVCMFYFIALYYEFKAQFDEVDSDKIYNYERIYSKKEYKKKLIEDSADLFLNQTINILQKTAREAGKAGNINNWIRSKLCQDKFFEMLRVEMADNRKTLSVLYSNFVSEYKV